MRECCEMTKCSRCGLAKPSDAYACDCHKTVLEREEEKRSAERLYRAFEPVRDALAAAKSTTAEEGK